MNIYIRPLRTADALISFHWRNDPEIWTYTASRPNRVITAAIETEWIDRALADTTSKRFAICIEGTDEYIGNVQLTDIADGNAQFHIFIGAKAHWGKGVATAATRLMLEFARDKLQLTRCFLEVNINNLAAIKSYEKNGFSIIATHEGAHTMQILLPHQDTATTSTSI